MCSLVLNVRRIKYAEIYVFPFSLVFFSRYRYVTRQCVTWRSFSIPTRTFPRVPHSFRTVAFEFSMTD